MCFTCFAPNAQKLQQVRGLPHMATAIITGTIPVEIKESTKQGMASSILVHVWGQLFLGIMQSLSMGFVITM